jgi:methylthioribose-1-phosphate isomerase
VNGSVVDVSVYPEHSAALNIAFDVTPARLVTGLITERGVVAANATALAAMFEVA